MVLGGALGPGLGGRDACGAASLLRGRRGTILHPRSFCVAGVAQTHIYCRFAWQAWHLWYWVALHVAGVAQTHIYRRGRRGTNSHLPSFCVAGVALVVLGGALGPGLGGRDTCGAASLLRGRRGTILHPRSFCVAGVAQSYFHGRFAWQAWHLWYWVTPLGPV